MSNRRPSNESTHRQSAASSRRESVESNQRQSVDSSHDEAMRRYSYVTKLVHYTSKFSLPPEKERHRPTLKTPVRQQLPISRLDRRRSTVALSERFVCFIVKRNRLIF